jgi:hypothetical protein
MTAATGRVCLILRGKKIEYAAIGELLGGNTRQGNGPASAYCRILPRSGTWGNSECEVWNYPSPKSKVHPPSLELLRRTRSPMPKVRRVGDRRSNEAKGNGRTAYPDRLVGAYSPPGTASELGARPGAWTGVSAALVGACSAGATIPTAKAVGYCQTPLRGWVPDKVSISG